MQGEALQCYPLLQKNVCSPRPRGRALPHIRNHPQTLHVRPSQVVAGTNTFLAMTLKTAAGATSSVQAVIFTPLGANPAPQLTNYKILPAAPSSAAAASAAKPAPLMKGAFSCSNTPMPGGLRCQVRLLCVCRACIQQQAAGSTARVNFITIRDALHETHTRAGACGR